MKLNEIFSVCENRIELLAFLQSRKLVKEENICKKCSRECQIREISERFYFVCTACNSRYSVAPKPYLFNNMKISYEDALKIMYLFTIGVSSVKIHNMLEVSHKSILQWIGICRKVCLIDMQQRKEKIGGRNKVVEIDESVFGKRKYEKGRFITGQWVVGGIERGSGACFLEAVRNRSSKTLIDVIKRNVLEETTIVTDEWKGYKNLKKEKYVHMTVNHSRGFVNSETGQHTNTIEGTWAKVNIIAIVIHVKRTQNKYPNVT